ncbi:MAG: hypothetical protein DRO07_00525 [Candidatus Iainarchaeum archaeon]|uniref:Uncharacterized protein n=1 Tax=Candidatus Iainarchaeum sp. TaxID=3101447 RepID=A0A497JJY5_9ARCH|nr:MAG: hypothetical protein DRO07_00525 [Candidatus Diapherotrites archaeon]
MLSRRAQSSFEMIMVTGIIIMLALTITSYLPKVGVSTGIISVLKSETLKELSKEDKFYFIEGIDPPEGVGGDGKVVVRIGGGDKSAVEARIVSIASTLEDLNFYHTANIIVEQAWPYN